MQTATVFLMTDSYQKISIRVLIVPTIATSIYNSKVQALPYLRGLKLAHPVTLDIASTNSGHRRRRTPFMAMNLQPCGQRSVFFFLGHLRPPYQYSREKSEVHLKRTTHFPEEIALERFWSLETMGTVSDTPDQKTTKYLQQYQKSIQLRDGRYFAKLPWKQDNAALPPNYDVTLKRSESTISRLRRKPEILSKYDEIIRD